MFVYFENQAVTGEKVEGDVEKIVRDVWSDEEDSENFVSVMNDEYVVIEVMGEKDLIFLGKNKMVVSEVDDLIEEFYSSDGCDDKLVWDVDKVIEWIYK